MGISCSKLVPPFAKTVVVPYEKMQNIQLLDQNLIRQTPLL